LRELRKRLSEVAEVRTALRFSTVTANGRWEMSKSDIDRIQVKQTKLEADVTDGVFAYK
jgi:hypothetical protein